MRWLVYGPTHTPEHGKEQDLQDGKCNKQLATSDVVRRQLIIRCSRRRQHKVSTQSSNDRTGDFSSRSDEQHFATTESFNEPQGRDRANERDSSEKELDFVRVETGVRLGKERRTVVIPERIEERQPRRNRRMTMTTYIKF